MTINIFICGVGGQGIGLMGDVVCQGLVNAKQNVLANETHGVAQRGGIVTSHIRVGPHIRTARIRPGEADLVLALERLEAARFAHLMLKPMGILVYYDAVVQPLATRVDNAPYPTNAQMNQLTPNKEIHVERVYLTDLPDPQMQNVALLGHLAQMNFIEGLDVTNVRTILRKCLPSGVLEANLDVFDRCCKCATAPNTAAPIQKDSTAPKSFRIIPTGT